MPTGIVRFFNAHKQYGFITPENGNDEVFVHTSEVAAASLEGLPEGTHIEFTLTKASEHKRSPYDIATDLKVIPPAL